MLPVERDDAAIIASALESAAIADADVASLLGSYLLAAAWRKRAFTLRRYASLLEAAAATQETPK